MAATWIDKFCEHFYLTNPCFPSNIVSVHSKLNADQSKDFVQEWLGLNECSEDPTSEIFIVLIHNLISHLIQKGVSTREILLLVKCTLEIFQATVACQLGDAISLLKSKTCYLIEEFALSTNAFIIYSDYMTLTYFRHFNLYQFYFSTEQQNNTFQTSLEVFTATQTLEETCLQKATPTKVWNYMEKYHKLEEEESRLKEERDQQWKQATESMAKKRSEADTMIQEASLPLNTNVLKDLIHDSISVNLECAKSELTYQIKEVATDVNFMLEKTRLPRPAELGPPPRFCTKTPIKALSKKEEPLPASHATSGSTKSSRPNTKNAKKSK